MPCVSVLVQTSILVFKDRDRYVTGDHRFKTYAKHNPRKMVKAWAEKEFRNRFTNPITNGQHLDSLPEDISGTWQIWNQAEKKWMPSDGVKVIAVGNAQVHIAGPPPAACREHQAKLGDFLRVRGAEVNGHAVYQKSDADVLLWKASGTWYIGPSASRGKMAGFWRCKDGAAVPEAIQGSWEVGDGRNWHVAEGVRCMEFVIPRVVLRGATPEERHKDKLGTYVLCEGEVVNARACYEQEANPERMLWFLAPYWYVGKREEKGLGQGWVQVRSLASVPEQIHATWSIWNSAEKRWAEAPELRIVPDTEARALVQV